MHPQDAIDLAREAILIATLIAAPALLAGMVMGLVVGLIQALTQIQEHTVAFVPKLVAMALAVGLTLPWVLTRLIESKEVTGKKFETVTLLAPPGIKTGLVVVVGLGPKESLDRAVVHWSLPIAIDPCLGER